MKELIIEIKATGKYTTQELENYIVWQLRGGALHSENPFIKDKSEAEIIDCKCYQDSIINEPENKKT